MRRVSLFLTTLILAALLLAACGGQETSTSVPSTNVPPITAEVTSTTDMTGTETETPSGTDMTVTPEVPVTGADSLARVSNMLGSSVCGMGGDQLGTVQDLVLDFDQTMVSYVIVDASGRTVAVPWMSFTMPTAGAIGAGTGTGTQADATATTTGGTGTGTEATATTTGGAGTGTDATATTTTGGTGSDTTGTGTTGQQDCLALTVDDDTFNMAPDFDSTTLPDQGQAATGWDESLSGYWANPGAGTGATGTLTTETPAAGSEATAMPDATATTTTDTGTVATATSTTGGTGTGTGQGSQQVQGVILATDVLGSTVMVSPQGNDQGTGTGTTDATATPAADSTAAANTPDPNATATTDPGTGGAGTGTGDMSQGTVEDIILDPETGDLQYLVVSFGADDRWFPLPIGFLNWDATTNGFVVKVNANALQNAPAFSADQFPDTSAEGWDQEWQGFWQNNGGTGTGTGTGGTTISTATATP